MDIAAFAAQRREQLDAGDARIRPAVDRALAARAAGDEHWWAPITDAAAQVWVENHQAEAPGARNEAALVRFRQAMNESLAQTSESTNPDRITRWASTNAVNSGTIHGAARAGVRFKRWLTMEDPKVRPIHHELDGRIVPMGSTFNVGGYKMAHPGVPVGPPELWIECRCVAVPAARAGEAMSTNTFTIGPDDEIEDDDAEVRGYDIFAAAPQVGAGHTTGHANPDGTPFTTACIVLLPAADDPISAASSEDAHLTVIWMGQLADMQADTPEYPQVDIDSLQEETRQLASQLPPITARVMGRGSLGDDNADVALVEPSEDLLAAHDYFLQNEQTHDAHMNAPQFPSWTPHVTLGYPDSPATGDYSGDSITFDRVGLWLGPDHYEYPMGGAVTAAATAPQSDVIDPDIDGDNDLDPTQDDDAPDDSPNEIPIHGVLAPEGVETGDGRGFRPGALSTRKLPIPFRTEVVGSHGGNQTSEVVDAGRIDEAWLDEPSQMWRFRGALVMSMPGANSSLESIITGVRTGVSIDADMMSDDMESYTEEYLADAQAAGKNPTRWFKTTRVSGLTHVPIPAFEEAYVGLGHEFEEDMTPEDKQAQADALAACGCLDGEEFRDVSTDERKRMADAGTAMPDGSYPIANVDDLRNAIQSIGRAKDPAAVKAHIKKRAAALGQSKLVPEGWSLDAEVVTQFDHVDPEFFALMTGDSFAPGTHDGPGWITNPKATARIRRYWTHGEGAAKIAWGTGGDFERCRAQLGKYVQNPDWLAGLCANMHKEALGFWPSTHRKMLRAALVASGAEPAPILTLVASPAAPHEAYPAEWFADPGFTGVTPLTIDKETRRVYGHLAQWKSCHIGINGACVKPPRSASHYANFLTGVIDTDQGEVSVGTLTYGIGHANPMMRAAAATAHYDQTDAVFAFVAVGEDAYGIWYAGVLRGSVDDAMVDDIRAIGSLSGDWRRFPRFGLDLVAAVSVNTPGYSLAADAGYEWDGHGDVQVSALGLGIVEPEIEHGGETHEQFTTRIVEMSLAAFRREQRREALAARVHSLRVADARARIERIG